MGSRRAAMVIGCLLSGLAPASASAGTYEVGALQQTGGAGLSHRTAGRPCFWLGVGSMVDRCAQSGARRSKSTLVANTAVADGSYVGLVIHRPSGHDNPRTTRCGDSQSKPRQRHRRNFWAHAYVLQEDVRVPPLEQHLHRRDLPRVLKHPMRGAGKSLAAVLERQSLFSLQPPGSGASSRPWNASPTVHALRSPRPDNSQIYAARIGCPISRPASVHEAPTGRLLSTATPREGEHAVRFAARDEGGGISRVGIVADGRAGRSRALEREVRDAFGHTRHRPVPPSGEVTLAFDTPQLPNGTHTIQASVTDAAGNETRSDP